MNIDPQNLTLLPEIIELKGETEEVKLKIEFEKQDTAAPDVEKHKQSTGKNTQLHMNRRSK